LLPLPAPTPDPPEWLEAVRARLRREAKEIRVESLQEAAQAAQAAAAGGAELIIAAGGDGTIRAVAENIVGSAATLGILPRGTVNVLARELGIPLGDIERAADICVHGKIERLDVGRIGGRYFLLMCSVGFDALTVKTVNEDVKNVVGAPAYVLAGLANLAHYTPARYTYQVDAEPPTSVDAFMIVVANASSYGGDYQIAPYADMTDGLLDIYVFGAPPVLPAAQKAAFLRQIGAVALGRHEDDPDVRHMYGRRVSIQADRNAAIQIDGDAYGVTPILIEVVPRALSVRVPAPAR
jgi:YegS/Rv2252/BmrU family lipid kinase